MRKGIRALMAAMIIVAMVGGAAFADQPSFTATIEITGNLNIVLGNSTTLTATWSTNAQDVNRYEWSVTGTSQGEVSIVGASSGSATFTFTPTAVGSYSISFRIWHHQQTQRDATESVTVVVTAPAECPAAPDVAGAILAAHGIDARYGEGLDGGNWESDVAHHMGPQTDFDGVSKCNQDAYYDAIYAWLKAQGCPLP